jgi:hypothetical protein
MATTANDRERALTYLRTIELMVNDLPEVAAEWSEISDGERDGWSIDWGNEMARLQRLAEYVADGALDEAGLSRYRAVLARLHEASPLIARLNLRRPSVPTAA